MNCRTVLILLTLLWTYLIIVGPFQFVEQVTDTLPQECPKDIFTFITTASSTDGECYVKFDNGKESVIFPGKCEEKYPEKMVLWKECRYYERTTRVPWNMEKQHMKAEKWYLVIFTAGIILGMMLVPLIVITISLGP